MTRVTHRLRALGLAASTASLAVAQAPAPPPAPFREGTVEASFVGTTGNSATQSVGYGSELILRPSLWEARFKLAYVRNEVEGVAQAEAIAATARGQRKFVDRASFFASYGYLSDRFAGTSARHTADFGINAQVIAEEVHTLSADIGGGYATDKRTAGAGVSTAIASAGALYKWKISATADFTEDLRYVGAIPDGADWRYTNSAAIAARISSVLSLKVSNTIRYVNLPVVSFVATDVVTSVAIVAKF